MGKEIISEILNNLNEIEGVTVEIAGPSEGTILVYPGNEKYHALSFKFIWLRDHFIGYAIDGNGNQSHAVVSLWNATDAFKFASAYIAFKDIWAKQR